MKSDEEKRFDEFVKRTDRKILSMTATIAVSAITAMIICILATR